MNRIKGHSYEFIGYVDPRKHWPEYNGPSWVRLALFARSPGDVAVDDAGQFSGQKPTLRDTFIKNYQGTDRMDLAARCFLFIVPAPVALSSEHRPISYPILSPLVRYRELLFWENYNITQKQKIISTRFGDASEETRANIAVEIDAQNARSVQLLKYFNETPCPGGAVADVVSPGSVYGVPVRGFLCAAVPSDMHTRVNQASNYALNLARHLGSEKCTQVKWEEAQIQQFATILSVFEGLEYQFQVFNSVVFNRVHHPNKYIVIDQEMAQQRLLNHRTKVDIFGAIEEHSAMYPDETTSILHRMGISLFLRVRGMVNDQGIVQLFQQLRMKKASAAATSEFQDTKAFMLNHLSSGLSISTGYPEVSLLRTPASVRPFFENDLFVRTAGARSLTCQSLFYLHKATVLLRQIVSPHVISGLVPIGNSAVCSVHLVQEEFGIFFQEILPVKMNPGETWKANPQSIWSAVSVIAPASVAPLRMQPMPVNEVVAVERCLKWLMHPFTHSKCLLDRVSPLEGESKRAMPFFWWNFKCNFHQATLLNDSNRTMTLRPSYRRSDARWFSVAQISDLYRLWMQYKVCFVPSEHQQWVQWISEHVQDVIDLVMDTVDEDAAKRVIEGLLESVDADLAPGSGDLTVRLLHSSTLVSIANASNAVSQALTRRMDQDGVLPIQFVYTTIPPAALVGYKDSLCLAFSDTSTWASWKPSLSEFTRNEPVISSRDASWFLDKQENMDVDDNQDDDQMQADVDYGAEVLNNANLEVMARELEPRIVFQAAHFAEPRRWSIDTASLHIFVADTNSINSTLSMFTAMVASAVKNAIEYDLKDVLEVAVQFSPIFGGFGTFCFNVFRSLIAPLTAMDDSQEMRLHAENACRSVRVASIKNEHVPEPRVLFAYSVQDNLLSSALRCGITRRMGTLIRFFSEQMPILFRHVIRGAPVASQAGALWNLISDNGQLKMLMGRSGIKIDHSHRIAYHFHSAEQYAEMATSDVSSQTILAGGPFRTAVNLCRMVERDSVAVMRMLSCNDNAALQKKLEMMPEYTNKHVYLLDFTRNPDLEFRVEMAMQLASWMCDLVSAGGRVSLLPRHNLFRTDVECWIVSDGLTSSDLEQVDATRSEKTNVISARHVFNQLMQRL